MRAMVISRPGPPEVLVMEERPTPVPARGEVRVRIRATAVNRADLLQRLGAYPAPPGSPADIPGLEFAGQIDALGEDVSGWTVGERVYGLAGGGTYAEYLVVPAGTVARFPDRLSFVEAAAIPEAFVTAWDAMVSQAGLAAGETVLISAVGSGVGTAAVQIARAIGARSIGSARSADKLERARGLGLDEAILVADPPRFAEEARRLTGGRGVDLVLELVGGKYLEEDLGALALCGRLVLVGLTGGARAEVDLATVLRRRLRIQGTVLRARPLEEKILATRILERHLSPLLAAGRLAPVIDAVLPLAEAAEAHRRMGDNRNFGKLVLSID